MHSLTTTYRSLVASMLAACMTLIVISGVIFMHKEVTSTGEIVTHIHPYDFTNSDNPHQHNSDAEIEFLNMLYQGTYLQADLLVWEAPLDIPLYRQENFVSKSKLFYSECRHYDLRGPPTVI